MKDWGEFEFEKKSDGWRLTAKGAAVLLVPVMIVLVWYLGPW